MRDNLKAKMQERKVGGSKSCTVQTQFPDLRRSSMRAITLFVLLVIQIIHIPTSCSPAVRLLTVAVVPHTVPFMAMEIAPQPYCIVFVFL
jgi:hypothetical protein